MPTDRGVPLITHSDFNAKCCTPYQVVRLAKRWPRVTIVLLHLGQDPESVAHTPDIVKDTPNIVVETSNTPDYPYPVFVNPARVLGADRVMFGSDGPVLSVEVNLTKLAVAEQVFGLTRGGEALDSGRYGEAGVRAGVTGPGWLPPRSLATVWQASAR